MALTEDSAAPALEKLLKGDDLTEDDALPISLLLGLQQMRSPTALDALGRLIEAEGRAHFETVVRDRHAFARNAGLVAMVDAYVEAGLAVGHADWHVLHSEDQPFVLNDAGLARFDERDGLPVPSSGHQPKDVRMGTRVRAG